MTTRASVLEPLHGERPTYLQDMASEANLRISVYNFPSEPIEIENIHA
jgi:hypothetical protein